MEHIHPALVHFPVALLIVGVLCDLARGIYAPDHPILGSLGLWCTTFGLIAMVPAAGSGLLAHTFQEAPNQHVQDLINYHERLSYLEIFLFTILLAWRWDSRGDDQSVMPMGYRITAILGMLALVVSSFMGGMLVYRYGMAVEATSTRWHGSEPMEESVAELLLPEKLLTSTSSLGQDPAGIAWIGEQSRHSNQSEPQEGAF